MMTTRELVEKVQEIRPDLKDTDIRHRISVWANGRKIVNRKNGKEYPYAMPAKLKEGTPEKPKDFIREKNRNKFTDKGVKKVMDMFLENKESKANE